MANTDYKNGVYRGSDFSYLIKDGKILLNVKGTWYKTNSNFMMGSYVEPLPESVIKEFDRVYENVSNW